MEHWAYGLIVAVFLIGYLTIALEHQIGIDKAATALLTAALCWILLVLGGSSGNALHATHALEGLGHHLEDIAQIVFFLIGALTIVHLIDVHGGFKIVSDLIRTRNRRLLLVITTVITFFLAPVLGLLPSAIVMTSLLMKLIREREDRLIFSCMVIIAANAGGAWSPIGDVTTTMLWIGGQVSAMGLIKHDFFPSLVAMLVPLIWFVLSMKNDDLPMLEIGKDRAEPGAGLVFFLGLGLLLFVPVFKALTGLPPFMGIIFALAVMWVVVDVMTPHERSHLRASQMFARVDFPSLLFFLGILLAVAALETGGILKDLAVWMDGNFPNLDVIAVTIGLASSIVDNVPLTAAAMGMYDLAKYPMDHRLWELLAYAVGTGGSILVIGSAAGVVVMGMEKITFGWYLVRVSLPALLGYLAGAGVYVLTAH